MFKDGKSIELIERNNLVNEAKKIVQILENITPHLMEKFGKIAENDALFNARNKQEIVKIIGTFSVGLNFFRKIVAGNSDRCLTDQQTSNTASIITLLKKPHGMARRKRRFSTINFLKCVVAIVLVTEKQGNQKPLASCTFVSINIETY
ncbi:hypothetical protein niasHS_003024 [Heterodera schachtii]|uniref:Uncharacterized protein n=1 Tax=Heterodera schachtii TaxID=97005 RepID=A0ABD2K9G9_HETSC